MKFKDKETKSITGTRSINLGIKIGLAEWNILRDSRIVQVSPEANLSRLLYRELDPDYILFTASAQKRTFNLLEYPLRPTTYSAEL